MTKSFFIYLGILFSIFFTACNSSDTSKNSVASSDSSSNTTISTKSFVLQLGSATKAFSGADHSDDDVCYGVTIDSKGNSYCTGYSSADVGEANGGGDDIFLMKVDSSGNLLWVTQFGASTTGYSGGSNSSWDYCEDIAVDSSDNVYCAGYTRSNIGEAYGGSVKDDIFFVKLDSNGNLLKAVQLGSTTKAFGSADHSEVDMCNAITLDNSGNIYCGGYTQGDIAEANAGSDDLVVIKFNSSGSIVWATQLGATTKAYGGADNSGSDKCHDIAVDSSGNVYCAGGTSSDLGEGQGGVSRDAFVLKLDSSGNIVWLTQLGATTKAYSGGDNTATDNCYGIALDNAGNVYCGGYTRGDLGETNGGNKDIFIMKLNNSGAIQWLTQYGATTKGYSGGSNSDSDVCWGIDVDSSGNVYCGGETRSNLAETNAGGEDAVILKLDSNGNQVWAKQLGTTTTYVSGADHSGNETCMDIAVDSIGNVYCGGYTEGVIGETNGGNEDIFLLKLNNNGQFEQ